MAIRTRAAADGEAVALRAGAPAKGEFRCTECGYGVAVHSELPECPMCRSVTWTPAAWRPFTRPASAGDPAERGPDANLLR